MPSAAFTRRHYELLAETIRTTALAHADLFASAALRHVAEGLADRFERDNSAFNKARFMAAIYAPQS